MLGEAGQTPSNHWHVSCPAALKSVAVCAGEHDPHILATSHSAGQALTDSNTRTIFSV